MAARDGQIMVGQQVFDRLIVARHRAGPCHVAAYQMLAAF
jgi:hypothetical protein